ncbi:MAG: hemerythrin family protein [Brevinematales bacterium]|nr:hemerythrin family protein [Brevinematales bacterium]
MGFMVWNDTLSVNIPEIDRQHQRLIDLINLLHDAMKQGKGKDVLSVTLDELAKYSVEHFTAEEKLMLKYQYPNYPAHKAEHESFIKKVTDFQNGFIEGKMLLSIEILTFLRDWTINHIAETDKKYIPFLSPKGLA